MILLRPGRDGTKSFSYIQGISPWSHCTPDLLSVVEFSIKYNLAATSISYSLQLPGKMAGYRMSETMTEHMPMKLTSYLCTFFQIVCSLAEA